MNKERDGKWNDRRGSNSNNVETHGNKATLEAKNELFTMETNVGNLRKELPYVRFDIA